MKATAAIPKTLLRQLLVLAFLFVTLTSGQACPGETPLEGQAELGTDESQELGVILDQRDVRLEGIYYCIASGSYDIDTHFRGFIAQFSFEGGTRNYQYGGLGDPAVDSCFNVLIPEGTYHNGLIVRSDTEDLEGFRLLDQTGLWWEFNTNAGTAGDLKLVYGPIIGFRVLTRTQSYLANTDVYERVPIYMSVLYNTCACSQSAFRGDSPPYSMQARAVETDPQTQVLNYQKDTIGFYHGQDCGAYTVQLTPDLPFLSLSTSGSSGPRNRPFTDTLTFQRTSIEDIGVYDLTMTIIQILEYGDGYARPQAGALAPIDYSFTVTVDPCLISDYQVNVQPERLTYIIGDSPTTGGFYNFAEVVSRCGYAGIVTVTNLPDWAQHNVEDQDFSVPFLDDLSLAAIYQIDIESTVSHPTSATDPTPRIFRASTSFEILLVNPCRVSELAGWTLNPVVVALGSDTPLTIVLPDVQDQASLDFGNQDGLSLCGPRVYSIVSSQTDYSRFMTFDGDRTLNILAGDPADVRNHFITLRVTLLDYPAIGVSETVFVVTIESCSVDSLTASAIPAQTFVIYEQTDLVFTVPVFDQTPDCGYALTYDIQDKTVGSYGVLPSFVSTQDLTLTVATQDIADSGDYVISVRASVPSQFQASPQTTELLIDLNVINGCASDEIATTFIQDPIDYKIGETGIISVQPVWQPNTISGCPIQTNIFVIDNSVRRAPTTIEATFVTFEPTDGSLVIENDSDLTLVGQSWLLVIVRTSLASEAASRASEIPVTINWLDECTQDVVTASGIELYSWVYEVGKTGSLSVTPDFAQSEPGCPLLYEVFIVRSDQKFALSPAEASVIGHSSSDGTIQASNDAFYSLVGQEWTIVSQLTSSRSQQGQGATAEVLFSIFWQDPCDNSVLEAPSFSLGPTIDLELYFDMVLDFSSIVDLTNGDACGGYTNELVYISGPALDNTLPQKADFSFLTASQPSARQTRLQGTLDDPLWLGTHELQIQSRNGQFDQNSVRGEDGLFGRAISQVLTITITNPCSRAVVNQDGALSISDVIADQGQASITTQTYGGPSYSVESELNAKVCGALQYELLDEAQLPFSETWFDFSTLSVSSGTGGSDQFSLMVEQDPSGNILTLYTVYLRVSLTDYPTSTPSLIQFSVGQRTCVPADFSFQPVPDQVLTAGDPALTLQVSTSQSPCSYDLNLFAYRQIGAQKQNLPFFMSYDMASGDFTVLETTENEVGTYLVGIEARLGDAQATKIVETFRVTVESAFEPVVVDPEPEPEVPDPPVVEPVDEVVEETTDPVEPEPTSDFEFVPPEEEDEQAKFFQQMPVWLTELADQEVAPGTALLYNIGEPVDNFGVEMTVEVVFGRDSADFASFDPDDNFFRVHSTELKNSDVGNYTITVIARATNPNLIQKEFLNSFELRVVPSTELDILYPGMPEGAILIGDFAGPVFESIKEAPYSESAPIPYIVDLSLDGVLTIGWDRKMQDFNSTGVLEDAQVAIRSWQEKTYYERRKLAATQKTVLLTNQTTLSTEEYRLVESLQVALTDSSSGEEEETERKLIEWTLLESSEDKTRIQLWFEDADSFAPLASDAELTITFWGVDFFKSQTGEVVRYGTELHWNVYRQISEAELDQVSKLDFVFYLTVTFLMIIVPCLLLAGGLWLPVWLWLNTLQLIAHLPMLNTAMPANLHYFLSKYLDLVRLKLAPGLAWDLDDPLDESRTDWVGKESDLYSENNSLLQLNGYGTLFLHNAFVPMVVLLVIAAVWLVAALKDLFVRRYTVIKDLLPQKMQRNHEPIVANFGTRFFYEVYLELAICALISFSFRDWSSRAAGFQSILAIVTFILVIAVPILLTYQLVRGKGPQVKDYFAPLTLRVLICWTVRQRTRDLNNEGQLLRQESDQVEIGGGQDQIPISRGLSPIDERQETAPWQGDRLNTERGLMAEQQDSYRSSYDTGAIDVQSCPRLGEKHGLQMTAGKSRNQGTRSGFNDVRGGAGGPVQTLETDAGLTRPDFGGDTNYVQTERSYDRPHTGKYIKSATIVELDNVKRVFTLRDPNRKSTKNKNNQKSASKQGDFFEGGQSIASETLNQRVKEDLQAADSIALPARYSTLHSGLRLNTERSVALVHPISFLLRRLILAFICVCMHTVRHTGLFLLIGYTLLMLAYACSEHQWNSNWLNGQHIFNETFLYVFCLFLVYFSVVETSVESRYTMGYAFMWLFMAWMATSLGVIVYQVLRAAKLKFKRSMRRKKSVRIKNDVSSKVDKLTSDIEAGALSLFSQTEKKDQKDCDAERRVTRVVNKHTPYGGYQCKILREIHLRKQKTPSRRVVSSQHQASVAKSHGWGARVAPIPQAIELEPTFDKIPIGNIRLNTNDLNQVDLVRGLHKESLACTDDEVGLSPSLEQDSSWEEPHREEDFPDRGQRGSVERQSEIIMIDIGPPDQSDKPTETPSHNVQPSEVEKEPVSGTNRSSATIQDAVQTEKVSLKELATRMQQTIPVAVGQEEQNLSLGPMTPLDSVVRDEGGSSLAVPTLDFLGQQNQSIAMGSDLDMCTPANENHQMFLNQLKSAEQKTAKFYEGSPGLFSVQPDSDERSREQQREVKREESTPRIELHAVDSTNKADEQAEPSEFLDFLNNRDPASIGSTHKRQPTDQKELASRKSDVVKFEANFTDKVELRVTPVIKEEVEAEECPESHADKTNSPDPSIRKEQVQVQAQAQAQTNCGQTDERRREQVYSTRSAKRQAPSASVASTCNRDDKEATSRPLQSATNSRTQTTSQPQAELSGRTSSVKRRDPYSDKALQFFREQSIKKQDEQLSQRSLTQQKRTSRVRVTTPLSKDFSPKPVQDPFNNDPFKISLERTNLLLEKGNDLHKQLVDRIIAKSNSCNDQVPSLRQDLVDESNLQRPQFASVLSSGALNNNSVVAEPHMQVQIMDQLSGQFLSERAKPTENQPQLDPIHESKRASQLQKSETSKFIQGLMQRQRSSTAEEFLRPDAKQPNIPGETSQGKLNEIAVFQAMRHKQSVAGGGLVLSDDGNSVTSNENIRAAPLSNAGKSYDSNHKSDELKSPESVNQGRQQQNPLSAISIDTNEVPCLSNSSGSAERSVNRRRNFSYKDTRSHEMQFMLSNTKPRAEDAIRHLNRGQSLVDRQGDSCEKEGPRNLSKVNLSNISDQVTTPRRAPIWLPEGQGPLSKAYLRNSIISPMTGRRQPRDSKIFENDQTSSFLDRRKMSQQPGSFNVGLRHQQTGNSIVQSISQVTSLNRSKIQSQERSMSESNPHSVAIARSTHEAKRVAQIQKAYSLALPQQFSFVSASGPVGIDSLNVPARSRKQSNTPTKRPSGGPRSNSLSNNSVGSDNNRSGTGSRQPTGNSKIQKRLSSLVHQRYI